MKDLFFEKFLLMENVRRKSAAGRSAWLVPRGVGCSWQQLRLLFAATRRRQPKLPPVSGGGGAEQVLHKELFHRVVACGSALVASSRGNGCVSLAMPFFVLCTRIELLFPCSFVPLSAVPCCFVPAVFSFVRWFTVFGFFNHFAISIVLNKWSLITHWATPFF